jgi:hypothetical protein
MMRWSDLPVNPSTRMLRQFGGLCLVILGAVGAWQFFVRGHESAGVVLALTAFGLGALGLMAPAVLRPIFVAWLVVAFPIGWVVSRVLMAVTFFGVITPLALFFRLRRRDALQLRGSTGSQSYWSPRTQPTDAASYFRQF